MNTTAVVSNRLAQNVADTERLLFPKLVGRCRAASLFVTQARA